MSAREMFIEIIVRARQWCVPERSWSVPERSEAKVTLLHPASRFLLLFVALMGLLLLFCWLHRGAMLIVVGVTNNLDSDYLPSLGNFVL